MHMHMHTHSQFIHKTSLTSYQIRRTKRGQDKTQSAAATAALAAYNNLRHSEITRQSDQV